ncbi:MAG TPA: hypothetical protein VMW32_01860 [Bacteroidales bacterium]|nr:hypothetical protein [Bacteroidales bacterium]
MKNLLDKLNYKRQTRIAVINTEETSELIKSPELKDIRIDTEIDQRYPYEFMIFFVRSVSDVKKFTPNALHNLSVDGILWFCYPKKSSKKYRSDIDRDHGWKALNDSGFYGIRMVAIDDDWSAMRLRNIKYIKSISGRYPK